MVRFVALASWPETGRCPVTATMQYNAEVSPGTALWQNATIHLGSLNSGCMHGLYALTARCQGPSSQHVAPSQSFPGCGSIGPSSGRSCPRELPRTPQFARCHGKCDRARRSLDWLRMAVDNQGKGRTMASIVPFVKRSCSHGLIGPTPFAARQLRGHLPTPHAAIPAGGSTQRARCPTSKYLLRACT